MTPDETKEETGTENAVTAHYEVPDLGEEILTALSAAGMDVDALTRADIAAVDEFHVRGLEATRELARLASVDPGSLVLDVGCGVGGPARTLAAEFDCEVVGVDLVAAYCRAARLFTELLGLRDAVSFVRGTALDLPFADAQFDGVWFEHVLMNVDATDRALAEAARILEPGGTLALYEICAGPGGAPVFPVPWASDPSISFLETPRRLRETVLAGGFEPVAWRDGTEPSLAWFRAVVAENESRPADAPPPVGLNLLMGEEAGVKANNVVRCLEEERITVVQGVFERTAGPD